MRVVVSAVKGAGKTTAIKFVKERKKDIGIITVGDFFAEEYKRRNLKRDEGDKAVSREEHEKIQRDIFKRIGREIEKYDNVIIDTNLFFLKSEGYFPGLPEYALREIKPDVIVVMEYKPEFILKRREKDRERIGRERSAALTLHGIEEEQSIQKHYAFVASGLTGCTVIILKRYETEKVEFEHNKKNAEEILNLFK